MNDVKITLADDPEIIISPDFKGHIVFRATNEVKRPTPILSIEYKLILLSISPSTV